MENEKQRILSRIPQVNQILNHTKLRSFLKQFSHDFVLSCVQEEVNEAKGQLLKDKKIMQKSKEELLEILAQNSRMNLEQKLLPSLKKVINATGIILHTGLGRAPLTEEACNNLRKITEGYCDLELNLETGKRGDRVEHVEWLLCQSTGAEAASVVNNNAAAVLLALNSLSFGKEAIISRGQLIEIGGSFRMPDVMQKSGATMVEVGTTNKTHLRDYENAITENTAVMLAVHSSNYRIKGFTKQVALADLAQLGKQHKVAVIHDLGGGVLIDLRKYGLPYEPVASESVQAGVDVITFSGDKVLGGPQCGIIIGKKKWIDCIKANPLSRAVRCDKLTYAVLEPTLRLYLDEQELLGRNRVLNMLLKPVDNLNVRAMKILDSLREEIKSELHLKIADSAVQIGSGAMPLEEIASKAISLKKSGMSIEKLAKKFRQHEPPIVGYIRDDRLFFDLRTVFEKDDNILKNAIEGIN